MTTTYGPLDDAPRGVRPPYTVGDPQRHEWVGESTEQWRVRMHADKLAALLDPIDGIELGVHDRRMLDWLAGWDIPTVATIASLLHRSRLAGRCAHGGAR